MEIQAKPTEYAGVLFRSKLEATWARFFDVIGVAWEYEPTKLPGWIPDFLIDGWWLAEVKPIPLIGFGATLHPPFAKAIREFDTVLLGEGPGDALGLLVRRRQGSVFARRLWVDLTKKETELTPIPDGIEPSPLTALWRGVVESSPPWRQVGLAMGDAP